MRVGLLPVRRREPVIRDYLYGRKQDQAHASVEDHIASRANAQQRTDCRELMVLFKKVTRHSPRMWGPSIVGYGSYRYTYESGRTGEAPLAGFAIRGRELVVYLVAEGEEQRSLLSKLGKHKMSKACLYFKQLADLDRSALEKLVAVRSRRSGGAMDRTTAPNNSFKPTPLRGAA
jgi:hypothetical protein